jgi:hypothetical protein
MKQAETVWLPAISRQFQVKIIQQYSESRQIGF